MPRMLSNDVTCAASVTLGNPAGSVSGFPYAQILTVTSHTMSIVTNCRKGVVAVTRCNKGKRNIIHPGMLLSARAATPAPWLVTCMAMRSTLRNPYLFMGLETYTCKAERLTPRSPSDAGFFAVSSCSGVLAQRVARRPFTVPC